MWGALLTRYLSLTAGQRGRDFLSAGRVQTPTLALLVDRDQAIKEFVPTPFWTIDAEGTDGKETFRLTHAHGKFEVRSEADSVFGRVRAATEGRVEAFQQEETRRRPPVPFSTTLFVSEATRQGMGAAYAMRIAEELYTQGLISYPRTDNTVYPRSLALRPLVERFKESPFKEAAEYVLTQDSFHPSRGRSETTDHPPIYPTGVTDPAKLRPDHAKLYELVVRRFLATVAPDSTGISRTTTVDIAAEKFEGKGQILTDAGWYRVYPYSSPEQVPMPVLVSRRDGGDHPDRPERGPDEAAPAVHPGNAHPGDGAPGSRNEIDPARRAAEAVRPALRPAEVARADPHGHRRHGGPQGPCPGDHAAGDDPPARGGDGARCRIEEGEVPGPRGLPGRCSARHMPSSPRTPRPSARHSPGPSTPSTSPAPAHCAAGPYGWRAARGAADRYSA